MISNAIKLEMLKKAVKRSGKIYPCGTKKSLMECFTDEMGPIILWYNDERGSTLIIKQDPID